MHSTENVAVESINDHTINVQPNRTLHSGSVSATTMGHTTVTPTAPATTIQSSVSSTPNLVAATGLAKDCAGCGKRITERFLLKALDIFWHEDCLKCGCCDCRLGEVGSTLYTKANLILCKRDYLRLFGTTGYCAACNKVIPAFEMVMRAKNNVYHLECFACQQCNHRFCVGDRFYLCDNKILCEYDYEERLVFASMACNPSSLAHIRRQPAGENHHASAGRLPPASTNRSQYVAEKVGLSQQQQHQHLHHQQQQQQQQQSVSAAASVATTSAATIIGSAACETHPSCTPATSSPQQQQQQQHQSGVSNLHLQHSTQQQQQQQQPQQQHHHHPSNPGPHRDDGSSGYGSPDSETFEMPNNQ
ncbi:insulin gene enhancer protein ISL-2B-like isoform X2 [Anopheles stephensi]|uniref:insulin gene enhancer protein ISL-2B-like isoform X2 n=1 Tax=Anopheles stephensi TaxID=30069 RepID=UPI001658BDD4|nr:insulin gene enhancer protein ISL-2B-like isoform X2 [Anopheles stephensi]